jgi:hypothetical protein
VKYNNSGCNYFKRALKKYGLENFTWNIIDKATNKDDLNSKESFWIEFFNTTNPDYGYNLKGGGANPFLTKSVCDKISKAQRGKRNHMFGMCGKLNPNSHRVILLDTGEVFDSVTSLCKKYSNLTLSKVCAVCRGERKTHKGHTFKYLREGESVPKAPKLNQRMIHNYHTGKRYKTLKEVNKYYKLPSNSQVFSQRMRKSGYCVFKGDFWYYSTVEDKIDCVFVKKYFKTYRKPVLKYLIKDVTRGVSGLTFSAVFGNIKKGYYMKKIRKDGFVSYRGSTYIIEKEIKSLY